MNHRKLLGLYGLKWNPFAPDLPVEALVVTPHLENFFWRVENLVLDGGFALVTGDPGLGKSVVLRLLEQRLSKIKDVLVAEFSRPQSTIIDFYRELGNLFGVDLRAANKYGGFRALREKWKTHIETTAVRSILLVDEAQEMHPAVLSELRLLSSMHFDSELLLTVVLTGDSRLTEKFRSKELLPLGSRIRVRLMLEPYSKDELIMLMGELLDRAGAPHLMTKELVLTLAEHAIGNPRVMCAMANELLMLGVRREQAQLDEKLYFEAFPARRRA